MKKIFISIVMILLAMNSWAQNGHLTGTIIDQTTGETLIGANVMVNGTSKGTVADFDGNYRLSLAAGTYSISVSFISNQTKKIDNIKILPDKTTHLNISLDEAGQEIGEVVVTAEVSRKSESAMMTMQRKSAGVMDGISMQQMSKVGAENAASALQQVTGVSVQGGKYVFVRGLGERYTKTTLNNAEIPSLDPEKNSVQLDIFPSNIIENISIKKTFTPDMPGEATGGQINIVTRDFPDELSLQIASSYTYNTQSSLNKHFIGYKGAGSDWFGFDNGLRSIPMSMQNVLQDMQKKNIEQISVVYYSPNELNKMAKSFNTQVFPVEQMSLFNQSHEFSIGNQIDLWGKKLGFNMALSYANKYEYYDNGDFGIYSQAESSAQKILKDRKGTHDTKIASLVNLSYKLNNNNKIGFRFMRNQASESIARYRSGTFNYESPSTYIQERNLSYLQRGFSSVQITGKHIMKNDAKLEWISSYVGMTQKEPDARFFTNLYEERNIGTYYKIKTNTLPSRIYRDFKESNLDSHIDFSLPYTFAKKSVLKLGAASLVKQRDARQHKFEVRSDNVTYNGNKNLDGNFASFLTNNIISASNPIGLYYSADVNNDLINSYIAFQSVYAAYAMTDINFNNKWRMIVGIRFESLLINTQNLIDKNDAKYAHGKLNANDFLPSLNLVYHIQESMNLRFAYSQTLARPMFKEIAPQSFYDYKLGMRMNGNPNLNESKVNNLDFRYEYFFKPGELFAISSFYKQFVNPIEMHLDPTSGNFEIMYVNGNRATLYGTEIEVRKSFWKYFNSGANLTLVKSVVNIQPELAKLRNQKTRPMVGQSPYVLNAYLGYTNEERRLEANINFNIAGEKLLIITDLQTPYIYEQPEAILNFNFSKGLGEHFSFNFSATNLLNSEYKAVYHYKAEGDLYNLHYSKGRNFSLGIKYKL